MSSTPVRLTERQLYKLGPNLVVGLTSRGTFSVTASRYRTPARSWEHRLTVGTDFEQFNRTGLSEQEIPDVVAEALAWLYRPKTA